jgi:type IV pilus assembly protein PilA
MKRESGFTLIELLVVVMILGILAAMTIMSLIRSRASANEASAIGSIRTIGSGQLAYSASCGRGFFATSLVTLGVPPPGGVDGYVSPDLTGAAVVQKSGYSVQLSAGAGAQVGVTDCNGTATSSAFYARAEPMTFGMTGGRSFATTSSSNNTIWMSYLGTAPPEPFGAPSLPLQ